MSKSTQILLATTNRNKVKEIRPFFENLNIDLLGLEKFDGDTSFEETGETFAENAQGKALHFNKLHGIPTIADDSGLVIDSLGGEPGVHSSRYLGEEVSHTRKIEHILERMKDIPEDEREAHFACSIAMAIEGKIYCTISKRVFGHITRAPMGDGGFGYDPIFFSPEVGGTFAQAPLEDKNKISHRGKAFDTILKLFSTHDTLRKMLSL